MTDRPGTRPPATLVGAAVLVGLEALVLAVLAVLEVANLDSRRVALGLTTGLFFLILAAGLALCARGLLTLNSWARGPVVATELIALLLSTSFWGGATTAVAAAIAAVAVLTLAAVLHPASTRALAAEDAG